LVRLFFGKNGKLYFAPCKAFLSFPSFLWDYDIACTIFLCPTEKTERTEIFAPHHAEPFCHFFHFCGTMISRASSFYVPRKKRKERKFYFKPCKAFLSFLSFLWDIIIFMW